MTTIDFVVLTGFLGSGKTTLLSSYLGDQAAGDTAVIVNEVGELDVDGSLIASRTSATALTLLSNGCLCCSVGSDLAQTVADLISYRADQTVAPLKRIVLETSGLSRPGPLLRSLRALAQVLRITVITTFDCFRGMSILEYPEAGAQVAGSQCIVLTKQELVSVGTSQAIKAMLAKTIPTARIVDESTFAMRATLAFNTTHGSGDSDLIRFARETLDESEAVDISHGGIRCITCGFPNSLDYDYLLEWLDNLSALLGDRLLRIKGIVKIKNHVEHIVVQSVGALFSRVTNFTGSSSESFIVIIARDLKWSELESIEPQLGFRVRAPLSFARATFKRYRSESMPAHGDDSRTSTAILRERNET
jgi:G3E family GTPase